MGVCVTVPMWGLEGAVEFLLFLQDVSPRDYTEVSMLGCSLGSADPLCRPRLQFSSPALSPVPALSSGDIQA